MSDWRKVCESIVRTGSGATSRPWRHGKERSDTDASLWSDSDCLAHFHADDDIDEHGMHGGHRDVRFVVDSANNADHLARFAMQLVSLIDEGWVGPKDAERWASEIWEETEP